MSPVVHRFNVWLRGLPRKVTWPWRPREHAHYNVAGVLVMMMLVSGRSPPSMISGGDAEARGRQVYAQKCAMCHDIDGVGRLPYGPRLDGSRWLRTSREDHLAAIILHGVSGPIPGTTAPYPVMAALGSWMRDDEIADVTTYVLQCWGGRTSRVTAETVANLRATQPHVIPWTLSELERLPVQPGVRKCSFFP